MLSIENENAIRDSGAGNHAALLGVDAYRHSTFTAALNEAMDHVRDKAHKDAEHGEPDELESDLADAQYLAKTLANRLDVAKLELVTAEAETKAAEARAAALFDLLPPTVTLGDLASAFRNAAADRAELERYRAAAAAAPEPEPIVVPAVDLAKIPEDYFKAIKESASGQSNLRFHAPTSAETPMPAPSGPTVKELIDNGHLAAATVAKTVRAPQGEFVCTVTDDGARGAAVQNGELRVEYDNEPPRSRRRLDALAQRAHTIADETQCPTYVRRICDIVAAIAVATEARA